MEVTVKPSRLGGSPTLKPSERKFEISVDGKPFIRVWGNDNVGEILQCIYSGTLLPIAGVPVEEKTSLDDANRESLQKRLTALYAAAEHFRQRDERSQTSKAFVESVCHSLQKAGLKFVRVGPAFPEGKG